MSTSNNPGFNVPRRCLVTGGSGFVGQRLVEMLVERGSTRVVSFDIAPKPKGVSISHISYYFQRTILLNLLYNIHIRGTGSKRNSLHQRGYYKIRRCSKCCNWYRLRIPYRSISGSVSCRRGVCESELPGHIKHIKRMQVSEYQKNRYELKSEH